MDGVPGLFERAADGPGDLRQPLGVDDGDGPRPVADHAGQLAQHARPDEDVVRVGAADVHPRHRADSSAFATSSTMSAGSRPSVSTRTVPSRS